MEIQYYGANCIKLSAKKVSVVIDDNLSELGASQVGDKANVSIFTQQRFNTKKPGGFLIDGPGEYEVAEVSVLGFRTRANTDHEGETHAVVYRVIMGNIICAVVGHIDPNLTDEQLEKIGMVDVLFVPVGGNGYTLDAKSAAKLAKSIDPKIVIPTHYAEKGIKFEVEQAPVEEFFKEIGATPEVVESLKLKVATLPLDKMVSYQLKKA